MVCRKMRQALELAQPQVRQYIFKQIHRCLKSALGRSSLCLSLFVPVRTSSPAHDLEASAKDFKFVLIEKENVPVNKETERLVMTKDTGKQFMSAAPASASGNTKYYLCSNTTTLMSRC